MAKAERKVRHKMQIRKGDIVHVVRGKERGALDNTAKRGKVLAVDLIKQRVIVERMNFIKRHTRPGKTNRQGGIVEKEAPIHVSNVRLVCNRCNKPTRVKMVLLSDGEWVRACRLCNEHLD
jgi:large subunit ribosomal protein L24